MRSKTFEIVGKETGLRYTHIIRVNFYMRKVWVSGGTKKFYFDTKLYLSTNIRPVTIFSSKKRFQCLIAISWNKCTDSEVLHRGSKLRSKSQNNQNFNLKLAFFFISAKHVVATTSDIVLLNNETVCPFTVTLC